jgi:hypothetical protein
MVSEAFATALDELARGVSDARRPGGYLALTAWHATVECGASEALIFAQPAPFPLFRVIFPDPVLAGVE